MFDPSQFPNISCMVRRQLCDFPSNLNTQGIILTLVVLVGMIMVALTHKDTKNLIKRVAIMATGVLLFELFTAPMWNSMHLGRFSYIYNDLSLTLTAGWTATLLLTIKLINALMPKYPFVQKFFLYLVPFTMA